MSPKSACEIDAALGGLALEDRVCALICSIITRRPQAVPAVLSLLAATTAMAKLLGEGERIALAEVFRDSADAIEHRRERVRV